MEKDRIVSLVLRGSLGFVFIYVGLAAFLNPTNWIGFLPGFLNSGRILLVHDVFSLGLGVWLISGRKTYYASIVSAIFLLGVIVFNWGSFDVLFRDIGLFGMAIALGILSRREA